MDIPALGATGGPGGYSDRVNADLDILSEVQHNLREWGTVATDASADLSSLVTTALGDAVFVNGGELWLPPGRLLFQNASALVLPALRHLRGAGPKLTTLVLDDSNGVSSTGIQSAGSLGVSSALTGDTVIGSAVVNVTNGALFTAGDDVFLSDAFDTGDGTNTNGTFISRVLSVAANAVTLEEAVPLVTHASSSGTLTKVTLNEGVAVTDLTIEIQWQGGVSRPTNRLYGLKFDLCREPFVDRVKVTGTGGAGVWVARSREGSVGRSRFDKMLDTVANYGGADPGTTTTSRAVLIEQSTGCDVIGIGARRCGFGVVASRSPYTRIGLNGVSGGRGNIGGRGIKAEYGSDHSVIQGNKVSDFHYTGIYVYGSAYVAVKGNPVSHITDTAAGSGNAIVLTSPTGVPGMSHHCVVEGNPIRDCQGSGVISSAGPGHQDVETFNKVANNPIGDVAKAGTSRYAVFLDSSRNSSLDNDCDTYGANPGVSVGAASIHNRIRTGQMSNGGSGFAVATAGSTGPHFLEHDTLTCAEPLSLSANTALQLPRLAKAGVPADADFPVAPPNGQRATNTSNGDEYIRTNGNWRKWTTT